jgi:hypothetical protein
MRCFRDYAGFSPAAVVRTDAAARSTALARVGTPAGGTTRQVRVFASAALRGVGLEHEARECETVDAEPIDAAYAASRAAIDISCMTSERKVESREAVAEIVATAAAHAYWRAVNEVDLVVPMAGDHAALAVIAWEMLLAKSRLEGIDLDWLWKCTAAAVSECLEPTAHG